MSKKYIRDAVGSVVTELHYGNNKRFVPGSRVQSIIRKVANDRANKIESVPFSASGMIKEVLDNSDEIKLRLRLGRELSMNGSRAVGMIEVGGHKILDIFSVIEHTKIGKFEKKVTGYNGTNVVIDDVEVPVYYTFEQKTDSAVVTSWYEIEQGEEIKKVVESTKVYPKAQIPVEVFYANATEETDVQYAGIVGDLKRLDELDSEFIEQWNISKSMPFYNESFTDNDPVVETSEIKKGRGYMRENSMSSNLGAGTQLIPANAGTTVLQANILFLEDDIYKKLFLKRDITGGNNKHTLEVLTSDEATLEYFTAIHKMRENSWNHLFEKMSSVLGETFTPITMEMSMVESAKWEWFNAQIEGEKAKTQNAAIMNEPVQEEE